jgi:hypothetical protein
MVLSYSMHLRFMGEFPVDILNGNVCRFAITQSRYKNQSEIKKALIVRNQSNENKKITNHRHVAEGETTIKQK